ncbi:MAG: conjugal transfer protein TraF [Planctomycetota bacterium]
MKRIMILAVGCVVMVAALTVRAEEWIFLGARAQGMGGAGVAVANDATAVYWNPAAYAFEKSFDVQIPYGVGVAATGDVIKQADAAADAMQAVNFTTILDKVNAGDVLAAADLRNALDILLVEIPKLDRPGQGLLGNVSAGLSIRAGHWGLSGLGLGNFGVDPVVDLTNLSFSTDVNAATQITNVVGVGADRTGLLTASGQALANTIFGLGLGFTQDQSEELVYQAEQAGVDTSSPAAQTLVTTVAQSTSTTGATDISNNQSGVVIRGLLAEEFAFTYARPFYMDRLAIGINGKFISGQSYYKYVRYEAIEDGDNLEDELTDSNNKRTSSNVGVDLGVLFRPVNRVRLGLVGRNLNSPDFDTNDPSGKYKLDAQVRAGAAVDVFPMWTVAADMDVTENESDVLSGFKSRFLSLGTEVRLHLWKLGIDLRAGLYDNIASSEDGMCYTGGIGLKLWKLQLDFAGGISADKTAIESGAGATEIPERMNLTGTLQWNHRF